MRTGEKIALGLGALLVGYAFYKEITPPPPYHSLTVATSPEKNVMVSVDGTSVGTSPISMNLEEGTHTIAIAVSSGFFIDRWEDETGANLGITPTITINLTKDKTLTAFLEEVAVELYCCSICPACFATSAELLIHMIVEHGY